MTGEQILALTMQRRADNGLRLEWFVPSEGRNFVAFARDQDQKQAWLIRAKADGWELVG